jgi:hypothetical protein
MDVHWTLGEIGGSLAREWRAESADDGNGKGSMGIWEAEVVGMTRAEGVPFTLYPISLPLVLRLMSYGK